MTSVPEPTTLGEDFTIGDVTISQDDFAAMWTGDELGAAEWSRTLGFLRRAARELTVLVGPLDKYDVELVKDTLIDAVIESQVVDNPGHLRSESDGGYSYSRFDIAGKPGRFWWPINLLALFGIELDTGRFRNRTIAISPAGRGWIG